jgi:hypothetical protein
MGERRLALRARTILGGVISFNKRRSTLDCNVRNFSTKGARVEFINSAVLPDEFDLTIARKEATFRARTVWRGEDTAGLVFLDEQTSSVVPLDWARKLKSLETKNKALRQRIADLSEGAI